jgi:prepilin-type N-terminal cleavage/methylation domain-containing protein
MEIFSRLNNKLKYQVGFTLIETLVALAISGFLAVGIITTIYQLQSISNSHYAHMTAVKQVENSVHYLIRDVQESQTVAPQGSQGFPLNLSWISWDTNDTISITYSLQNGELVRSYQLNSNPPVITAIARFIVMNSANTSCGYDSPNHKLTLQLTSTVTSGNKQDTETRKVEIIPRPGS